LLFDWPIEPTLPLTVKGVTTTGGVCGHFPHVKLDSKLDTPLSCTANTVIQGHRPWCKSVVTFPHATATKSPIMCWGCH